MDADTIKAIDDAQAAINVACLQADGLYPEESTRVKVFDYQTVETIAEMLYGTEGWRNVHVDHTGGWTYAYVKSPRDVEFFYSDYSLDDAIFHIQRTEFMDDGSMVTSTETVKAVGT